MLYHLLVPLASDVGVLNVFRYITFRTGAATLTALFIAFMVGPGLIRALARLRVGQVIREVGPAHQAKAGTPTMGGLLILLSTLVSVLLWSNLDERGVWILMGLTGGYGVLGFIDDIQGPQGLERGVSAARSVLADALGRARRGRNLHPRTSTRASRSVLKNFPHTSLVYIPLARSSRPRPQR